MRFTLPWRWLILGIIGSVACSSLISTRSHSRNLLQLSVPVVDLDVPIYSWQSCNELLVARRTDNPGAAADALKLVRYNRNSRAERPLRDPSGHELTCFNPATFHDVSGDGRWRFSVLDSGHIEVVDRETLAKFEWARPGLNSVQWMQDDHRLCAVQLDSNYDCTGFSVFDIQHPTHQAYYALPRSLRGAILSGMQVTDGNHLLMHSCAEMSPPYLPDSASFSPRYSHSIQVTQLLPAPSNGNALVYNVRLPCRAQVMAIGFAPDGKEALWVLVPDYTSRLEAWILARASFLSFRHEPVMQLWTSKLNGQDMRQIGAITPSSGRERFDRVTDFRWLPDSRHVSFMYGKRLMILDTE